MRGIHLRDMSASHHFRQIHDRDERSASRRCLSRIKGSVGNHPIDGTGNLGIVHLGFGVRHVTLRDIHLRLSHFEVCLFLCEFIYVSSLGQRHVGVFDIFRGNGSFLVERLATVIELLLRVQSLLRKPDVLLDFLGLHVIGYLGLLISTLALQLDAGQILIFEFRQQLPGFDPASAIHVKLLNGSDNFRHDRRLVPRI